jgi:hypothetical protein
MNINETDLNQFIKTDNRINIKNNNKNIILKNKLKIIGIIFFIYILYHFIMDIYIIIPIIFKLQNYINNELFNIFINLIR